MLQITFPLVNFVSENVSRPNTHSHHYLIILEEEARIQEKIRLDLRMCATDHNGTH